MYKRQEQRCADDRYFKGSCHKRYGGVDGVERQYRGCLLYTSFTRYNQYESLILPMQKYLEAAGVQIQFGTEVTNVRFDIQGEKKVAKAIEYVKGGEKKEIALTEDDFVFITNGSCTEGTIYGDQNLSLIHIFSYTSVTFSIASDIPGCSPVPSLKSSVNS